MIDDLNKLWSGVLTYDVSRKKNFMIREALMWTINDFLANGMLFSWGTHGRLTCSYCMENTKAFQLANGGKSSWFDSHRGCYQVIMHLGTTKIPSKKGNRKG